MSTLKNILSIFFLSLLLLGSFHVKAQTGEICYNPNLVKDTSKRSIKSVAASIIGNDSVKINYHSPGVRGRIVWGGLVPYDEVWVTGAHDATTLEIAKSFTVAGKVIPAGKYALFTIPGKKEWTIIINSKWQQHLATEYDQKDDVIRLKVKPQQHAATERLQYFIESGKGGSGKIAMAWEKIRIEFPVTLKN
ncbi:DUF2911 domain-containing protein [Chitinophaga sp. 212800010-3]|uniref:DUF2911 domain-containing protein n=1 Tax=unclassified Chitinophaga TaxID=2619133 RepID=UPI002DE6D189|nr:DUF2911 domain-containing protein [Chitinophaga sp. 212800010-3]